MQKKEVIKIALKAVIMGVLCCSIGDVVAQGNVKVQSKQMGRFIIEDVCFSLNGERVLTGKGSIQKGNTINVNVSWNNEYVKNTVFDSACFVRKLTPEEQARTGKTEELIRDKSFVPYSPTPEEVKKCKYAFSVKPQATVVYFYTSYRHNRVSHYRYVINVTDENGQKIYYQKLKN